MVSEFWKQFVGEIKAKSLQKLHKLYFIIKAYLFCSVGDEMCDLECWQQTCMLSVLVDATDMTCIMAL